MKRKQRNRAMMIGNHKGPMHIDTPLQEDRQVVQSQHSRAKSSVKNKARSMNNSSKYSKANTKFRSELNLDLNLSKADSLEITRKRGRSMTARENREPVLVKQPRSSNSVDDANISSFDAGIRMPIDNDFAKRVGYSTLYKTNASPSKGFRNAPSQTIQVTNRMVSEESDKFEF